MSNGGRRRIEPGDSVLVQVGLLRLGIDLIMASLQGVPTQTVMVQACLSGRRQRHYGRLAGYRMAKNKTSKSKYYKVV